MWRSVLAIVAAASLSPIAPMARHAPEGRRLFGHVTIAGTDGAPGRRAVLTLTAAGGGAQQLATADDEGRFEFRGLAAGKYTLSAARPGFVTAYFGSSRPGRGPGLPIVVDNSPVRADLELLRGAVIAGTVRDPDGRARSGGTVAILERRVIDGEALLLPVRTSTIGYEGRFRFYGLAPGTYFAVARPNINFSGARVPSEEEFAAAAAGKPLEQPLTHEVVFAPTLFPSATDPARAQPIVLAAGDERPDVDILLQLVPSAHLQARVIDQSGYIPRSLQVTWITPAQRVGLEDRELSGVMQPRSVVVTRDGAFSRKALPPGRYSFFARAVDEAGEPLWGVTDLDVNGIDVNDMEIRMTRGLTVAGRLVIDAAPGTIPPDLTSVTLRMAPMTSFGFTVQPARAKADQAFSFTGVSGGIYRLDVAADGWTVASVRRGSGDSIELLEAGLQISAGQDVGDLLVTITNRAPTVRGRLVDSGGRPATALSLVLISADARLWTGASRRTRVVRPDSTGAYIIAGLPAGEYLLAAVSDAEGLDLSDPDAFAAVAAQATKLTLAQYEQKTLDLKVR